MEKLKVEVLIGDNCLLTQKQKTTRSVLYVVNLCSIFRIRHDALENSKKQIMKIVDTLISRKKNFTLLRFIAALAVLYGHFK